MAHSVRIRSIYLRNFIGIKTGLNRKEIEVNFSKIKDKDIILILGENGSGKTTFMSVLHCLPGTTDGRQKFILEDKEGIKKIVYDRSDGYRFECKIVYTPTKTGHSAKGFVNKIAPDGSEEEINENGNITSYKDIVAEELGITDAMLKLANQNDVCKGHVDMTATERKVNMSTFLPDDIYSDYYNIVDKTYKELKTRINILVESIGKMHDEDTLVIELEKVTKAINELVEKRDKCTRKIAEYQTRIDVIHESGIEERNRALKSHMKESYDAIERIQSKIEALYASHDLGKFLTRDATSDRITAVLKELGETAKQNEINSRLITTKISELKLKRNYISEQIEGKKSSIADLETDHSLDELKDILKEYLAKADELEKQLKKAPVLDVTKDTFMIGYEIIANIRNYIDTFGYYDFDLVQAVCTGQYRDFHPDELLRERTSLTAEKDEILSKMMSLDSDESRDSILEKRPQNCQIDSCPFIANAYKLKKIQEKIPQYTQRIDEIVGELSKIESKLAKAQDMESIKEKLTALLDYIKSNMPIIKKLPNHEKYSSQEAIVKVILKGKSLLADCDEFDDYIENLENKEEYDDLVNKKIPQIKHEIELLETKGKFITSTKEDLERLTKEKSDINDEIEENESKLDEVSNTIEYLKGMIDALGNFQEKKSQYDSLYDQIITDDKELKEISVQLSEILDYREKIAEKRERLNEIEAQLNPLTRERELYKMEQLKIADNKQELDAVNEDMYSCEIIRAALSVKDNGIPVGALEFFMDTVRQTANALLSKAFNGNLYLEEFVINTKEFAIPYKKNGDYGLDVSYSSSSERSFISLCLTLAIIEEIVTSYSIVCLDEVDRGMANNTKYQFIEILMNAYRRAGITQMFMITHNAANYYGYDNIGYILFPGAEADLKSVTDDNSINISKLD